MKSFDEYLAEVTVVGKSHQRPIMDNDTVRVYHGTSDIDFLIGAVKYGFTGDRPASRKYSYETNNNPKGLFVTPDFETAKNFGQYVIEFQTRVSDLESPVWPGGTFTVQGGKSGVFSNEQERELERLRQREKFSNDEMDYIRNSDRPELAAIFLASGEQQALFTGSMNKNGIRAIWLPPEPEKDAKYQSLERVSVKEFLKRLENNEIRAWYNNKPVSEIGDEKYLRDIDGKLVKPREKIGFKELVNRVHKDKKFIPKDKIRKVLVNNLDYVRKYVWSDEQFNIIKKDMER